MTRRFCPVLFSFKNFVPVPVKNRVRVISDELICPKHYKVFRNDRNRYGGGVALLVRNDITVSEVVSIS